MPKLPKIIFENKNFLIINKPKGLVVHSGKGVKAGKTLVDWLANKYPQIKKVGENKFRPGIVHRLDRDTGGLMVVALNQKVFDELKQQFQDRKILKEYEAWVWGKFRNKKGVIKSYLIRNPQKRLKRMVVEQNQPKAKYAETYYEVLKELDERTKIKLILKTGRTHQIRVQMAYLRKPVVNDKLYGFRKQKIIGDGSLRLRAKTLVFSLDNKKYLFSL